MRRIWAIVSLWVAVVIEATAAYNLTAVSVQVDDVTVDKANYFVTVETTLGASAYTVGFDVWPQRQSVIGAFSLADNTIRCADSFVHKTLNNGSPVNRYYFPNENSQVELTITDNGDSTCTLSGRMQAVSAEGDTYTYVIADFVFPYTELTPPDTEQDPYRFEPEEAANIVFEADVVDVRVRQAGLLHITLNEMANEAYNWLELALVSDTCAIPAGLYEVSETGEHLTLTASRGYLGVQNDDPCYLALRDGEEWGSYTPYYIVDGGLTVSYNELTDTIYIEGTLRSKHGSTIAVTARSYNMLYVPSDKPREPEDVTLSIDSVVVTYMRQLSDGAQHRHLYTFNFFDSSSDAFPQVLVDAVLSDSAALVEGVYTLADGALSGLELFQNQADFNERFFGGQPYVFASAELQLTRADKGRWQYRMLITDTIGSTYHFDLTQHPHIINYPPDSVSDIDPKDKPFADEQRTPVLVEVQLDSLQWIDRTVAQDGVLDIVLMQHEPDAQGLRAYLHLGFFTSVSDVATGIYPVDMSEDENSFSASVGRYGDVLIPCYLTLLDDNGWAHAVWYIVDGQIAIDRDEQGRYRLSGECTSYFGSTIRFSYQAVSLGVDAASEAVHPARKFIRHGQLHLQLNDGVYDVLGRRVF